MPTLAELLQGGAAQGEGGAQPPVSAPGQLPQAPQQQAPQITPEELQQRKSVFKDFFTKIQSDPNTRQSILLAASRLLQGQRPGENVGTAFGDALQIGTLNQIAGQQRDLQFQQQQARFNQKQQQLEQNARIGDSQIAGTNSLIEQRRAQLARQEQLLPGELAGQTAAAAKAAFDAENRQGNLEDARANSASQRALNSARAKKALVEAQKTAEGGKGSERNNDLAVANSIIKLADLAPTDEEAARLLKQAENIVQNNADGRGIEDVPLTQTLDAPVTDPSSDPRILEASKTADANGNFTFQGVEYHIGK